MLLLKMPSQMIVKLLVLILVINLLTSGPITRTNAQDARPRARTIGLRVGILPTGTLNAITDVNGVAVGHTTFIQGNDIRTGVTAILPHSPGSH